MSLVEDARYPGAKLGVPTPTRGLGLKDPANVRHSARVRAMFTRVAERYDLMNSLMTAGQDVRWRRHMIDLAYLPRGGRLLDLGAGTGGLALEAARRGSSFVVAADFTLQMMHEGRRRSGAEEVRWMVTDAHQLPFSAGSFDVVVSGYLMRNVADLRRVWSEQYRVLKPGGRVICLDTTPPPRNLAHWVVHLYLRRGVPALGRLVAHARDAYAYLSDSTEEFLAAEELARCMVEAGFRDVGFRRFMFGAMALHWGRRADALPTQFQRYNQTQRESKPSP